MNILKYSREQVQQLVRDGVAPVEAVRDWDIATARNEGKSIDDISFENRLSRRQVFRVVNKLQGRQ